jgi:hypothetical protein
VRVPSLFLHHLRPGSFQLGWLACPAHTQILVLLVLLLVNPLLSNHWLLLNHVRDSLRRGTKLLNGAKTIVKIALILRLKIFVVSKASGRSLLTTHLDRIYTQLYEKTLYRTNNISRRKNIVFGGCGELIPPEIYK